jgi:hypothetical protein
MQGVNQYRGTAEAKLQQECDGAKNLGASKAHNVDRVERREGFRQRPGVVLVLQGAQRAGGAG